MRKRQQEVLDCLLEGMPDSEICKELGLAIGTIKVHLQLLYREFGVNSRLQLVCKVYKEKLAELQSKERPVVLGVRL